MLAMRPSLSIVIIAYNEEAYIGHCLDAIAAQTVKPNEVIVVNNNSQDRTAEIAAGYPFVTLVDEPEQGMIPARNAGLNLAQGPLIARIDADTRLTPQWVERVHRLMDEHAGGLYALSGPGFFYSTKHRLLGRLLGVIHFKVYFLGTRLLLGHPALFGSNMVLTRRVWQLIKSEVCKDGRAIHEDIDIAFHITRHGGHIAYDSHLVVGVSHRDFAPTALSGGKGGLGNISWRLRAWIGARGYHTRL